MSSLPHVPSIASGVQGEGEDRLTNMVPDPKGMDVLVCYLGPPHFVGSTGPNKCFPLSSTSSGHRRELRGRNVEEMKREKAQVEELTGGWSSERARRTKENSEDRRALRV
ncbi:unnamed protein product [Ilex paraguariensis]|uniref:Uncharacterized protein n=1 Tax=Ilex paraguariensis TaxID=185542 RepID=A0ABC8RKJ0_9AQUA